MKTHWPQVVTLAALAMLVGLWLFRLSVPEEAPSPMGLTAFAALGASIGCLWSDWRSGG